MADSYPADGGMYGERPRRRRGRKVLITLIVLLLVLVGLLAVADRVVAGIAERAIAQQVNQEMGRQDIRASAPEVTVGGFPFLTQVLAGRYDSIGIVLRDVQGPNQGQNQGVRVPELIVDAQDVTASLDTLRSGQGDVVAETVKGTGTIAYDSVVQLINKPGVTLREENGKLAVTAPVVVPILNQQVLARGNAELAVQNGQVVVSFENLTADELPNIPAIQAFIATFAETISVRVPLPPLPFALEVQEVRALPEGLAVTATARNVSLNAVT